MAYRLRGYHATTLLNWNRISSEGFKPKFEKHHWLGQGIYFYQEAPKFALYWATRERHEGLISDPVIVEAEIEFDGFLDLVDHGWATTLAKVYELLNLKSSKKFRKAKADQSSPSGKPLPHPLDRYVIDATTRFLSKKGVGVRAVRAVFFDGVAIFAKSHLFDRQHIQIAVRDTDLIATMRLAPK